MTKGFAQATGRNQHASDSLNARTRRRILSSKDRMWRAEELPGPSSTRQHLLTELTKAGELKRIRKGLYWRGRKTPLGMSPPPHSALTTELSHGRGVGPAGLSASNLLRLSTQIPRKAQVAVPHRAPTEAGSVKFVSRAARTGRRTAQLNPVEVALLEALDGWTHIIEIPIAAAWEQMRHLMRSEPIRPDRLARASKTEPGSVRARLAVLLDDSGYPELAQQVPAAEPRTTRSAFKGTHLIDAR